MRNMYTGMHINSRMKSLSPKARFTKWAECEDPFWTMHVNNCGYDSIESMRFTLEHASERWTLRQRTRMFFGYDEKDMRKPVSIVQFRIKFNKP